MTDKKNDKDLTFKLGDLIRPDGRQPDQIREIKITRPFQKHAEGSVLVEMGDTKVVCSEVNKLHEYMQMSQTLLQYKTAKI